jgi:hypothetical protein
MAKLTRWQKNGMDRIYANDFEYGEKGWFEKEICETGVPGETAELITFRWRTAGCAPSYFLREAKQDGGESLICRALGLEPADVRALKWDQFTALVEGGAK